MKSKRINDTILASIPVQNGQVLKGEHLAILREVLSAAINGNKFDIDRIVAGQDAVHVYGESVEDLDEYVSENTVADETLGYLYTENQILLYTYLENTNTWLYLGVLNLTELFNKTQELDARISDLDAHNIPFNGSGTNYLVGETEIEGAIKELDTRVSANEIDLNSMAYFNYASSIYGAKYNLLASAWEHSLTVDPLEISVDSTSTSRRGMDQYPNGETEGVIIPHGVTNIGNYAFRNWIANDKPLVIPNSVTSIGNNAFTGWNSNNHPLIIPDSVTSLGNYAFSNWNSNNHPLIIPDSVTSLGNYAFQRWQSNNHPLVIPDSVTSIGGGAFFDWQSNNHSIVIPASVTSIGDTAFDNWLLVPYIEMKGTTPPTLAGEYTFSRQNDAPIYVPDESVNDYKTATNWSLLADRIFAVSEKP